MKATGTALASQVCNVDPIAALLGNNTLEYQKGAVGWVFWYLQFSCKSARHLGEANPHVLYPIASDNTCSSDDHPGNISIIKQLALPSFRLDNAACITRLIDILVVARFFEIGPLQENINQSLFSVCMKFVQQHFFIFTKRPAGPLRFKQYNIPGLLESTTPAIFRAAPFVPANSRMWSSVVLVYRTRRQVDDFTDVGEQVNQHIRRLSSISAFASAWLRATFTLKTVSLDGIFSQSPNWALQTADCACSACSMRVWRRDLVERLPGEVATGAVQKYALINPFDGFKTVFCDYCFRNCGVPWGNGNKPCDPHE